MEGNLAGPTLAEWLAEYKDEIEQSQAFAVTQLPDEPAEMGRDLGRANSEQARMGFLLTDAETFLLKAHAASMMAVRVKYPEINAEERKIAAKAEADYIQALRLRDNLKIIVDALKSKSMAIMNLRRTTFTPQQSHE